MAFECTPARRAAVALLFAATAPFVAARDDVPLAIEPLALERVGPAAEPNVAADGADGTVMLTWQERKSGTRVRAAALAPGATAPAAGTDVPAERALFVNWADFPAAVRVPGGPAIAYSLQRSGEGTYAYDVVLARQAAGGTWTAGPVLHDDGTQTEHGFASLAPWGEDRVLVAWLDGRATAGADGHDGHDGHGGHGGAMTLRAALVDGALAKHGEWELDASTCDCCQTDLARTASGAVLVWRDRAAGEIRDVAAARFDGKAWSKPALVHADGWHMPACPVNGPQVAARGDDVLVAWYTGAGAAPSVRVARSRDGGATFGAPVVVDADSPLGRVDVAWLGDGDALVTWLAVEGTTTRLTLARLDAELATRERHVLATLEAGRSTGFPRMAVAGDGRAVVVWTAPGKDGPRLAGVRVVPGT